MKNRNFAKGYCSKIFRICLLVSMAYFFTTSTCLAETAIIPGYSGSGVWSVADLSSAVFQPSSPSDTIVAVCVKEESRSGEKSDKGIWYFWKTSNGNIYVKTNGSNSYDEYFGPNESFLGGIKQDFFRELAFAAKNN